MAASNIATTNSLIEYFQTIISSAGGSIPKGSLWIAAFENLETKILPGINLALTYEPGPVKSPTGAGVGGTAPWSISKAASILAKSTFQQHAGCIFCQAIDIPGETIQVNPEGNIVTNSFLRSYVGGGRADMPRMRMTFYDSHLSFTDNILRPWSLSTATFGMVARPDTAVENYRTNLTCWQLGTFSSADKVPTVIKTMNFYGVCCISVNNEELNYDPSTQITRREAQFVYHYYTVDTTSNNSFIAEAEAGIQQK